MNTIRSCGCKGVRSCLICEKEYGIVKVNIKEKLQLQQSWAFCIQCQLFYKGWEPNDIEQQHPHHQDQPGLLLPGILVQKQFLNLEETENVMQQLNEMSWCTSQSGRRKQNFGPKTNFKKHKLKKANFIGFPKCTEFIQYKFKNIKLLSDFQTIEQCTLEYVPANGAHIDPHIDDCWIWGERVVTVNCKGSTVLTLTLYEELFQQLKCMQNIKKYNLHFVASYQNDLIEPLMAHTKLLEFKGKVLRIPMPTSSLVVLYGPARYQFEHCVLRDDILERRVCLAYREFTKSYLHGGEFYEQGREILENAKQFFIVENNEILIS